MAQYLDFPPINSETCPKKSRLSEMKEHEIVCSVKTARCKICNVSHPATEILSHFVQQHRTKVFYDSVSVFTEHDIGKPENTNQFFMIVSGEPYMISTETYRGSLTSNIKLTINVAPFLQSFKYRNFTITFSTQNNTTIFKKTLRLQDNVYDCRGHTFNLSVIKQMFLPDESEFKIGLKLEQIASDCSSELG